MPDFSLEQSHPNPVCGLDEVGRAPLAGPVVAACVYIDPSCYDHPLWQEINDSKKISAKKRAVFSEQIKNLCEWGIGEACMREIEQINILQASFLAMRRAYENLQSTHNFTALIDGHLRPKEFPCPSRPIIKGDSKSVSIAAASIIAKVYRDDMMAELAIKHPHYGWERNAGYPTKQHMEGINAYGITDYHRRNFAPVNNFIEFGTVSPKLKKTA